MVQLKLFRSHTFRDNPAVTKVSLEEHRKIFDAVRTKDGALAGKLLKAHAVDSLDRLRAATQNG
ncbi:hypothetical protein D9M70_556680 [compost metagenome]